MTFVNYHVDKDLKVASNYERLTVNKSYRLYKQHEDSK